jgi:hypothetical protein
MASNMEERVEGSTDGYEPPALLFLGSVEEMTLALQRGPFDAGDGFRVRGPDDF